MEKLRALPSFDKRKGSKRRKATARLFYQRGAKVYKNIDNGIYTLNMPKKYMIDGQSKIIDIDSYSVQSEPEEIELIENKKEE